MITPERADQAEMRAEYAAMRRRYAEILSKHQAGLSTEPIVFFIPNTDYPDFSMCQKSPWHVPLIIKPKEQEK